MPFAIERNDIARAHADVIVNAANERLAPGGGVCGAIYAAAGFDDMLAACTEIGRCPTGGAVATPGFGLDCRWVVHAVGPVWRGGTQGEEALLRSCYRSVFAEAARLGAVSVAFPLISAGIYGYPQREAIAVAREESAAFLEKHGDMRLTLVLFSRDAMQIGLDVYPELQEYIDDAYTQRAPFARGNKGRTHGWDNQGGRARPSADAPVFDPITGRPLKGARAASADDTAQFPAFDATTPLPGAAAPSAPAPQSIGPKVAGAPASLPRHARVEAAPALPQDLTELLQHLDGSFSETLLALIDERGLADATVYKRANISRQLFAKIRSNAAYKPKKPTAVALALALELTYDQTQDLLARAGFTLSRSSEFDIIIEFFIGRGEYNVLRINEALFAFDQPLLGSF